MEIEHRIREARKNAGMTQQQLADMLNMNRNTIAKYETGLIKNPDISTLKAIADATNVDIDWLTGRASIPATVIKSQLHKAYSRLITAGITDDDPVIKSCTMILETYADKVENHHKLKLVVSQME